MSSGKSIERWVDQAVGRGLDPSAAKIIMSELDAATVAGCRGIAVRGIMSEEITLLTLIHDGSFSMTNSRPSVIDNYVRLMETLRQKRLDILVSDWMFNDEPVLLHGFVPVDEIPDFASRYNTDGSTALYDTVLAALTGQLSYAEEFYNDGGLTKNIVIVFSDGGDCASKKDEDGSKCKKVSQALLATGNFILGYVGFSSLGQQLNQSETRILAEQIGFPEVISGSNFDQVFSKLTDSIIRASNSTALVPRGDFFK